MTTSLRATTIYALVLTTALVGCARRPAVTSMASSAPAGSPVAPPPSVAGPGSTADVIAERRDEIVVERREPAAFEENRNVKTIYFDFDRYDIRPRQLA